MLLLIPGLVLFLGNHSVRLVAPQWRERFIEQYGANTWKVVYSVFSLVGLALIIYGYGASRTDPVFIWNPPVWTRHLALLLAWVAFILIAAYGIPRNHLKQRLGHPMYMGIKVWAFAHLIANGRLGDILLFGAFLAWAVAGYVINRRRDRLAGVSYPPGQVRGTVLCVVAGTLAWALITFWLHRLLIGVPPLAI